MVGIFPFKFPHPLDNLFQDFLLQVDDCQKTLLKGRTLGDWEVNPPPLTKFGNLSLWVETLPNLFFPCPGMWPLKHLLFRLSLG